MGWISKLKGGLGGTSSAINNKISKIFTLKKLDEQMLEELEETLIMADLGVKFTMHLIDKLRASKFAKEITSEEVRQFISNEIKLILGPIALPLSLQARPTVICICGVNGGGKTTTVGKLALQFTRNDKKVLLSACDTFRAAAVEQLHEWAKRSGAEIITGQEKGDASGIAYQAVDKAIKENFDVVLIDTAGRMHTKTNLMEELTKINRVLKKLNPEFPQQTILVLDATTGQNAMSQIEHFRQVVDINGLIITKLDSTAKGGIVVSIADTYNLPIYYVGIGEQAEDLMAFNPKDFADNLLGIERSLT